MKGDTSFSILSKEDDIHFIHEQKFFFYMATLSPAIESLKAKRRAVKIWGLTV